MPLIKAGGSKTALKRQCCVHAEDKERMPKLCPHLLAVQQHTDAPLSMNTTQDNIRHYKKH